MICLLLLLPLLSFCAVTCQYPYDSTHASDRRVDKASLSIVEFNAEWLFLSNYEKRWSSFAEAERHLDDVAAMLSRIQFDIAVLLEVESCDVLASLKTRLADPNLEYYLVPGTDSATGQNVGILTRITPDDPGLFRTSSRADYPELGPDANLCGYSPAEVPSGSSAVSKHAMAYFTLDPPETGPALPSPLFLVGTHLLAFPDEKERCIKRQAQASVLAAEVRERLGEVGGVIVTGDLNDFDGTVLDVRNSQPISTVLDQLKDVDEELPGDELLNAASYVNDDQRFTAYYSPGSCRPANLGSSSIDHVLLSHSYAKHVVSVEMLHDYPPPCASQGELLSDHWPVRVVLSAVETVGLGGNDEADGDVDGVLAGPDGDQGSGAGIALAAVFIVLALVGAAALYKHRRVVRSWYNAYERA
uniref:Endonuclease/exonuclease/phosphatase domain-containing protein n=1 Tax=Sexangularia sp. CB-2014 TaxID=1486929 RepID=A0A7S1YH72_9EUKA